MAVDDEDNRSEPSNVASSSARDFRKFPLALVIGVSVGGVLLLIILVALAVLCCRKRQPKKADVDGSGKKGAAERNMNHYSIGNEAEIENGAWAANTAETAKSTGAAKRAMIPNKKAGAKSAAGPGVGVGAVGTAFSDPVYDNIISRRGKDPNWDPNLLNNREGGGAHIKKGHVLNAVSTFDNKGFSEQ